MPKQPRDFPTRARFARERAGFANEQAAADAIGCGRTTVIRWEKDAKSISGNYLHAAARAYLVRPEWLLLTSDDDGYPTGLPPRSAFSVAETPAEYVRAVDMGMEGDMGEGRVNDDHPETIRAVDYTQQYIRSLVGFVPPPGRLVLVTGRGDSMMPTIQPGESLLVDTGVRSYDGDGIYLVNLGNGQQIKRLVDHGETLGVHVHSDNPAYPTLAFPKEGIVAGKVYVRNRVDRFN